MGGSDRRVSTFDIHLQKLLWMYSPGHAGVKGNDRVNRLTGKATNTSGLFRASSFEELSDTTCGHKASDIGRPIISTLIRLRCGVCWNAYY